MGRSAFLLIVLAALSASCSRSSEPTRHDVTVRLDRVQVLYDPSSTGAHGIYMIGFVDNLGDRPVTSVTGKIFLSVDSIIVDPKSNFRGLQYGDDYMIGWGPIGTNISAHGNSMFNFQQLFGPSEVPQGDYYVGVIADPDSELQDDNRANNQVISRFVYRW